MSEWIPIPGESVVMVRTDRGSRSVRPAKVLRVGKRDIVLDNGERFRVRGLDKREGGTWGWVVKLVRPDDPFVLNLREEIRRAALVNAAKGVCDDFRYGRNNVTAFDVLVAVAPLTGLADQVAELVSEATP